jgi:phage gp16-like protein
MKPELANKIREREIRLIHVAKNELQMAEDTYRSMLWAVARVKSAKDLDFTGRKKVLDHLKACGFKVKTSPANKNASDSRYRKIRALWKELKSRAMVEKDTDQAVRAYIKRTTGCEDFQFLNNHQISTVIESLKNWLARADENRDSFLKKSTEDAHV